MSGTLTIDCVEILGFSKNFEFWGDVINYRCVENYTAKARFKTRDDLAYSLWTGISGMTPYVTGDYFDIYAGTVYLGFGKLTSFSSEGGTDVTKKFYDIGFQVLQTGDLSFLSSGMYMTGNTGFYSFFPFLNSFTESFEYSQDHSRTIGFNHSLDFDFERGFLDRVSGASGIQSAVLNSLTDFGIYHPVQPNQFGAGEGIKRSSFTLDSINGRFSSNSAYEYQSGLPYTWEFNHSLSYGENGVSSLSEGGRIVATKRIGTGSKIAWANSGWNVVKTGIFPRVSGFFSRWSGYVLSSCNLQNDPIEKSVTRNIFDGSVSYNYSYSNDLTNYSGYFWSYENQISQSQSDWTQVTEEGSIRSKKYTTGAVNDLIPYFNTVKAGVTGRVNDLYGDTRTFFKNATCSTGTTGILVELENESTYISRPAEINYSYLFSDDPSNIGTGDYRRVKVEYSDNQPVHLVNFFNIVNSEELAQGSLQSTLGVLRTNVEIVGTTGLSIASYYARATGEVRRPTGVTFISDEQYSFDPFTNQFTFSRDYTYSKYRGMNDYLI